MYCHQIPCNNPIINEAKKIIAIDGGYCNKPDGQLNAFIIQNNQFYFTYVDKHPLHRIEKPQAASGGTLAVTFLDRAIEILQDGEKLCQVKHLKTGKTLTVPKSRIWTEPNNPPAVCDMATDYHLPVNIGDEVSLIESFDDRLFVKMDGVSGWVRL
jgi:hypothetical protein